MLLVKRISSFVALSAVALGSSFCSSSDPLGGTAGHGGTQSSTTGGYGGIRVTEGGQAGVSGVGGTGGAGPSGDELTTIDGTLTPTHAVESAQPDQNPALFTQLPTYTSQGFGNLSKGPGEGYSSRSLASQQAPTPGPHAKRLARFVHITDMHVMDDESPTRAASLDAPGQTSGAARPQDPDVCRMNNAAVHTINKIHERDPISFVLLGGDITDNAQTNELDWVLSIFNGGSHVKCDSGNPDDPVPGPNNDGKDAFMAEGLRMPWYWGTGNHDVLVQGTAHIDGLLRAATLSSFSAVGTRDYTQGGRIRTGNFVVPDSHRALLSRTDLMRKVASDGNGHGLGSTQIASGKAIYAIDVLNTPVRVIVYDTGSETGGAEGMLHRSDLNMYIKPLLDQAKSAGKWVILASHHATDRLTKDGGDNGLFGPVQADAVLTPEWESFVGSYGNVILSLAGHAHANRVKDIAPPSGQPWWEVTTSAIIDFPHQFRIVETWDEDNGFIKIRTAVVNYLDIDDPVSTEGRMRGVIDFTSGWEASDGRGSPTDRNVELWIRKPR